ncbi:MAG TPA: DUF4573 domain-containing protein, partial [Candidatus Angelobacter sp.]
KTEPVAETKPIEKVEAADEVEPAKPEEEPEPVTEEKPVEKVAAADEVEPAKPEEKPEPVAEEKPVEKVAAADEVEPAKPEEKPEPVAEEKPVEKVAAADEVEPAKPVEKTEPVAEEKPVEKVAAADEVEPAKPVEKTEPVAEEKSAEKVKAADEVEPAKPEEEPEPVTEEKPVEKVAAADEVEPAKPEEEPEPVAEAKPVDKVAAADEVEPAKPVEETESVTEEKPVEKVAAADEVEPAKPVEKTEPVAETKPIEKVEAADEVEPAKPEEKTEPVAEEKSAEKVKAADEVEQPKPPERSKRRRRSKLEIKEENILDNLYRATPGTEKHQELEQSYNEMRRLRLKQSPENYVYLRDVRHEFEFEEKFDGGGRRIGLAARNAIDPARPDEGRYPLRNPETVINWRNTRIGEKLDRNLRTKISSGTGYDAGHLVALEFGSDPNERRNISNQNAMQNEGLGTYRDFERRARAIAAKGYKVGVDIETTFTPEGDEKGRKVTTFERDDAGQAKSDTELTTHFLNTSSPLTRRIEEGAYEKGDSQKLRAEAWEDARKQIKEQEEYAGLSIEERRALIHSIPPKDKSQE